MNDMKQKIPVGEKPGIGTVVWLLVFLVLASLCLGLAFLVQSARGAAAASPELHTFDHETIDIRWCGGTNVYTGWAFVYPVGQAAAYQWIELPYLGLDAQGCARYIAEWGGGLGEYEMTELILTDGQTTLQIPGAPWLRYFVGIPDIWRARFDRRGGGEGWE